MPRFLALYTIRDCEKEESTAACRAIARPRRYAIERDAELEPEEALARTAAPERQWQADAHTVEPEAGSIHRAISGCSKYGTSDWLAMRQMSSHCPQQLAALAPPPSAYSCWILVGSVMQAWPASLTTA